jgi:hypothetical protein
MVSIKEKERNQHQLFKRIVKTLTIQKAVALFGEKDVRWAINRYLMASRERARLLRQ